MGCRTTLALGAGTALAASITLQRRTFRGWVPRRCPLWGPVSLSPPPSYILGPTFVGRPATRASLAPKWFGGREFVWVLQQMCSRPHIARIPTSARPGLGRGSGITHDVSDFRPGPRGGPWRRSRPATSRGRLVPTGLSSGVSSGVCAVATGGSGARARAGASRTMTSQGAMRRGPRGRLGYGGCPQGGMPWGSRGRLGYSGWLQGVRPEARAGASRTETSPGGGTR